MPKAPPILIPQGDPESLRRQITNQVNLINRKLAQSSNRVEPMDLGHNRITSVADPGAPTDAVNLRTLKKHLDDITQQHVQRKQANPTNLYGVVFSSVGSVVSGQVIAPYIILPQRAGTPVVVKCAAGNAPVGSDFIFNITRNGANILSANGTLSIGQKGPVTFTGFTSSGVFDVNDLIVPSIIQGGSAAFVTIEVEVQI